MVSPGVLLWGGVLSNASPVINNMHGSPVARGCANGINGCSDLGQLSDGVVTTGCDSEGLDNRGSATAARGVIKRRVLTRESLWSKTSLIFHSTQCQ